jgi:hypothetical protein
VPFTLEGLFAIYRIFDNEPGMVNNPSAFALALISCGASSLVGAEEQPMPPRLTK